MKRDSKVTGLVAAMIGLSSGCGTTRVLVSGENSNFPADNVYVGPTMELYEEDLQQAANREIVVGVDALIGDAVSVKAEVLEDDNGRRAPFNLSEVNREVPVGSDGRFRFTFADNTRPYVSGETWPVSIVGYNANGLPSGEQILNITYHSGKSPDTLTGILDDVIDRIDDLEDIVHPETPAVHPSVQEVVDYACDVLPRSVDDPSTPNVNEGFNIGIYALARADEGFTFREIGELSPNAPGGSAYHHRLTGLVNPGEFVAGVAGVGNGSPVRMSGEFIGSESYTSAECPSVIVLNAEVDSEGVPYRLTEGQLSTVRVEYTRAVTAEVIRAKPTSQEFSYSFN